MLLACLVFYCWWWFSLWCWCNIYCYYYYFIFHCTQKNAFFTLNFIFSCIFFSAWHLAFIGVLLSQTHIHSNWGWKKWMRARVCEQTYNCGVFSHKWLPNYRFALTIKCKQFLIDWQMRLRLRPWRKEIIFNFFSVRLLVPFGTVSLPLFRKML